MSRVVVAWCELRSDFRHFRTDRMHRAEVMRRRYPGTRAGLLGRWRVQMGTRNAGG